MQTVEIEAPDGTTKTGFFVMLEINPTQQVAVIACDDPRGIDIGEIEEGYTAKLIGSLRDQQMIFAYILVNSLNVQRWPFDLFDNPELILITKTDDNH